MRLWMPQRVYFEPSALNYPMGQQIYAYCKENGIPILQTTSHNQVRGIPGETEKVRYANARKTLVVGTKKSMKLDVCKPSAHYQFSLMTNCPGNCEYCYLFTTQGKRPYVRVYANLEEIFQSIEKHMESRLPQTTLFEAASTGDPLAVEHITGALAKTIEYFGGLEKGRLRVATKFANVDSLLNIQHQGHTRFRFSINTEYVIRQFEHHTEDLTERLKAAEKTATAGYPLGFIIAPIMRHANWKEEYAQLIETLDQYKAFHRKSHITFELIQHRFTQNAKEIIQQRYPNTKLNMNEEERVRKYGKYGRVKYIYPKDEAMEIKETLSGLIKSRFPNAHIHYFT